MSLLLIPEIFPKPGVGVAGLACGGARGCQLQLTSLSLQWTLTVSEQIQKQRAFLVSLQLEVLQVVWLVLEVTVTLVLPLLLPLALQVGGRGLAGIRA